MEPEPVKYTGVNRYKNDQCNRLGEIVGRTYTVEHQHEQGTHRLILFSVIKVSECYDNMGDLVFEIGWSMNAPFSRPHVMVTHESTKKSAVLFVEEQWCPMYDLRALVCANLDVIKDLS